MAAEASPPSCSSLPSLLGHKMANQQHLVHLHHLPYHHQHQATRLPILAIRRIDQKLSKCDQHDNPTVYVGSFRSNLKAMRNKNCVFLFLFLIKTFPTSVSQISSVTGAHDPIPNCLWPLLSSITHLSRLPMPCSIQMKKNLANAFSISIFYF